METILKPDYSNWLAQMAPMPCELSSVSGFVCTLEGALLPSECEAVITAAESSGFSGASLYTDKCGKEHFSDIRKSQRIIIDSRSFVDELWKRIAHIVPPTWNGLPLHISAGASSPLNERLRILKYATPGDEFQMHSDGQYVSPDGGISQLTILIYLNVGYIGAYTHFLGTDGYSLIPVIPTIGGIVIQDQRLDHCVPPLISGTKYVVRTEVMYKN